METDIDVSICMHLIFNYSYTSVELSFPTHWRLYSRSIGQIIQTSVSYISPVSVEVYLEELVCWQDWNKTKSRKKPHVSFSPNPEGWNEKLSMFIFWEASDCKLKVLQSPVALFCQHSEQELPLLVGLCGGGDDDVRTWREGAAEDDLSAWGVGGAAAHWTQHAQLLGR